MNWNKTAGALFALAIGVSAGCANCGDDTAANNTSNNGTTNNGTPNNGTPNNGTPNNGSSNNGNVVDCLETQMIDLSFVTEDTVVEKSEGICYSSGSISISAKLTIEPGVSIAFSENAEIRVNSNGKLEAKGTSEDPILFTGADEVRGYWKGIVFDNTESLSNVLDHVFVEYAGGSTAIAAVHVFGDAASVAVTNTTIRESKKLGFALDGLSELRDFSNNTVTSNETGPAMFNIASAPQIGTGNALSGNDIDAVFLQGGRLIDTGEVALTGLDVPYRISAALTVEGTSDLVIGAGATIEFDEGTGIVIQRPAGFAVQGAEGSEVTLTGLVKERGSWHGIELDRTNNPVNAIDWAIIEYAGGGDTSAGLALEGRSDAALETSITNTILRENEGFGLALVNQNITLSAFENNTLTSNTAGPVSLPARLLGQLAASDYTGNDVDFAHVEGEIVESPQTVLNIGVPYRVDANVTLREGGAFAIDAGTVFEFAGDTELSVEREGSITAVGDAANPIVFRGQTPTAGFWKGVALKQTGDMANKLQFVEIYHGGSSSSVANLSLNTCCTFPLFVEISDVKLADGSKAGLDVTVAGNPPADFVGCGNITFENVANDIVGTYATLADFQAACQ